ncbi:2,3-dihydroxy-2,3-dihydrophenylpropionate dehydrogenase [Thermomonospora echinospora]|uniref:2,3-dihydroxy-2,3-dihydrophenylpropionate dehydrogenase n=1 Tax=Thermomonospora echinospora TaxID=1992 RepID=A0A1H6E4Y6_9ACTN|nr:SDR family oxidoreductase [Thermomonospora echinospora]SEG91945.1 2,3-dihydroxy-2,3-dihydrophenylpropionate dehydrogenase [Thermomonospora echinospora]
MTAGADAPRSVVVTGCASGIGAAVARAFAARGAHVVGVDLVPSPDAHVSVTGDVRDPDVHERAVQAAVRETGGLDVLVPNAGIHDGELGLDADPDELAERTRRVLEVDVLGYVLALRAAAPELVRAKGSVVMTLSDAAHFVGDNHAGIAYTAAKHALVGVLRWAAHRLAPDVRVNGVAPGGMPTGLRSADGGDVFTDPAAAVAGVAALNPLGSVLAPAELAESYVYLASAAARGMTGEVLRMDGGLAVR